MNTTVTAAWRAEADARISAHRQADFSVLLRDAAGQPLPGAPLQAQLRRHAFGFGTAIAHGPWASEEVGERYRAFILRHFNCLVCENEMKWYAVSAKGPEEDYAQADALLDWAGRHQLKMRGHCLFWTRNKFIQPWLQALSPQALRAAMERHLEAKVRRYHGRVTCWDVNNEMLDGAFYAARLGPDIDAWMFREAARLSPGTPLFVNEFAILGSVEKTDRYLALIAALRDRGAPVTGIGVQEHGAERLIVPTDQPDQPETLPERARREGLTAEGFLATLDRLATPGLPIHLTEISAKSPDATRRADALEMLFRLGFSHPAVESILLWGFWANCHWLGAEAALVDADWNLTEAGERISHLLTREWTTTAHLTTGPDGVARFRGFAGDYEISTSGACIHTSLSKSAPAATVCLPGGSAAGEPPATPTERKP
jgi:GH35 family endo-1,4-beta-xylanase